MSKKQTDKKEALSKTLTMHEKFTDLFVISIFTIFPIYMTNKLFNVRSDRLHYFVVTTFVLLFFIAATYLCGIDKDRWRKGLFKMSIEDISFLSFVVVCLVSAILSKYGEEAFSGSGGRDSGFYLMAMYLLSYMLISRYFRYREVVFTSFAVMSSVICFIALLHEFWIDPFAIIVDIKAEQQKDFISTIGNINMFSCFVCVSLSVCMTLTINSKDRLSTIFYSVTTAFNFIGLLCANSLSGYFGLVAFTAILLIYACGTAERLFKFCLLISTMLISTKVARLFSHSCNNNYKNLEDISYFLIYDNRVYIIVGISIMVTVLAYLFYSKNGNEHFPKWVQITIGAIVTIAALGILGVFIYFSFIDKETDLGKLSKILRLNDQWGTHRGYAWIRGMELFRTNGIKNILVGSGPDTFGQLIKETYREDMISRHGSVFDTAHNEFLNYLVTTGILGFVSYVTLLISILIRSAKRCSKESAFIIVIIPIISYCAQSIFNLATPIITPFLFVFLGIAEGMIRCFDEEHKEEKIEEII